MWPSADGDELHRHGLQALRQGQGWVHHQSRVCQGDKQPFYKPDQIVSKVSKKMTKEQIEAVFAKFDHNGDGKMSKDEFKELMAFKK